MSDATGTTGGGPFRQRLMLLLVALGVLAFLGSLVLGAYEPALKSGKDGGTHAMSNAAVGFSGLYQLAEATGRGPVLVRRPGDLDGEELAVVSPPDGAVALGDILEVRGPGPTLIVLPKWWTKPRPSPKGWVSIGGLKPVEQITNVLEPAYTITVTRRRSERRPLEGRGFLPRAIDGLREPRVIQTLAGDKVEPLLVDSRGAIVLGKVDEGNLYLLADPDLLNNYAMADRSRAAAALRLLDELNSTGSDAILFDLSANGFGGTRNPLQLLFGPPFVGVTLIVLVALLLVGWQAIVRFGAPRMPARTIGFGKNALVENSAALIHKAGRETALGARYADIIRERAALLFHLPGQLSLAEIDARLDELRPDHPFSELARALDGARTRHELTAAAGALNRWLQEART